MYSLKKEFKPKFFPDNPLTENIAPGSGKPNNSPGRNLYKDKKRVSIPKEDTHPGAALRELNGEVNEVDAKNLLGEDDNL